MTNCVDVDGTKADDLTRATKVCREQYGESLAPNKEDHHTMGNFLMFTARDMGHKVEFTKPFWANTYTEKQLRFREHSDVTSGYW